MTTTTILREEILAWPDAFAGYEDDATCMVCGKPCHDHTSWQMDKDGLFQDGCVLKTTDYLRIRTWKIGTGPGAYAILEDSEGALVHATNQASRDQAICTMVNFAIGHYGSRFVLTGIQVN